jgi:L-fuconolactonase
MSAWLESGVEAVLEPTLPLCDPHHHLWNDPRQRYLPEEFRSDIGQNRVLSTVYVECARAYHIEGPEALRPAGETEFVHGITAGTQAACGTPRIAAGIVGFADLRLGAAVDRVLEAHMKSSDRFRGIRYASAYDSDSAIRPAHTCPPPGLLADPSFRAGIACLYARGLTFDAWLYHPQIPELRDLARSFPGLAIVLNHVGGPLRIGHYASCHSEVVALWRRNLAELAGCPNVYVKLGGLTMKMMGFDWHKRELPPSSTELANTLAPYIEYCIEYFGTQRCMFESNFPLDRVSCSYTTLWNAFKRLAAKGGPAERADLLHDTAARFYRLTS